MIYECLLLKNGGIYMGFFKRSYSSYSSSYRKKRSRKYSSSDQHKHHAHYGHGHYKKKKKGFLSSLIGSRSSS